MTAFEAFNYLKTEVSRLGYKYDNGGQADRVNDRGFIIDISNGRAEVSKSGIGGTQIPISRRVAVKIQFSSSGFDIGKKINILGQTGIVIGKIHDGQNFIYEEDSIDEITAGYLAVIYFRIRLSIKKE